MNPVSYTHLRAHETPEQLVCRLLLEKKKKIKEKQEINIKRRDKRVARQTKRHEKIKQAKT